MALEGKRVDYFGHKIKMGKHVFLAQNRPVVLKVVVYLGEQDPFGVVNTKVGQHIQKGEHLLIGGEIWEELFNCVFSFLNFLKAVSFEHEGAVPLVLCDNSLLVVL